MKPLVEPLFKFLGAGSVGRFSGFPWPAAGKWVTVDEPLRLCVSGIHVCRSRDLPYWLDDELWEVEASGDALAGTEHLEQLVFPRVRLVAQVKAWPEPLAAQLSRGCLDELWRLAGRELELSNDPDSGELAGPDDPLAAARLARELANRSRPTRTVAAARLLGLFADAGDYATDPATGTAVAARFIAYTAAHAADNATLERRLPRGATGLSEERRRQADELARALSS